MSRLPKAPLEEVIFEIRWDSTTEEQLNKYTYLIGDLYNSVKTKFEFREQLIHSPFAGETFIGLPAHRFWTQKNTYPLIQLGPGILTVNTLGGEYDWDNFSKDVNYAADNFFNNFSIPGNEVDVLLQYIDFIPFDFTKDNVIDFIEQKMHTKINQSFYTAAGNPDNLGYLFSYEYEDGKVAIEVKTGKKANEALGLIIRTVVSKKSISVDLQTLMKWGNKAHTLCSDVFKKMMEGELYNSFS